MKRGVALLVCLMLLAAGCSRGGTKPKPPAEMPAGPDPLVLVKAEDLLPRPETAYSYNLSDGTSAEEWFVHDGDRLIGAYNGKAYVTWFITQDGVWRQDPKGTALLRYLPPTVTSDLTWKQTSGTDEVWFRLQHQTGCQTHLGAAVADCWDLSVLNRDERTTFRLGAGQGVLSVRSENYAKPAESYTKSRREPPADRPAPPAKEQLLKDGGNLPAGALPPVTIVTAAEFDAATKALLGGAVTEVDLNGDGKLERIEGKLGEWTDKPFHLYDSAGKPVANAFLSELVNGAQNRLEVVSIKGIDRPGLLYSMGYPGQISNSNLLFWDGAALHGTTGWHPKLTPLWSWGATVQPDGLVVAAGSPERMGGYTWTRYYRIAKGSADYTATLEREELKAGAYPTEPQAVLTAAFVTHWYGKDADLPLYAPDAEVQQAIRESKIGRPGWVPGTAKVGKLVTKQMGTPVQTYPDIEPAPLGADGTADFLIEVGEYEGSGWWSGRVTFGPAKEDGRLVIRSIEFKDTGWVY